MESVGIKSIEVMEWIQELLLELIMLSTSTELCTEELKEKIPELHKEKKRIKSLEVDEKSFCQINYGYLPYDILRLIFKHLTGMELSCVAMVCSSWLVAAKDEHFSRGPYLFELSSHRLNFFKEFLSKIDETVQQAICPIKISPIRPSIAFFHATSSKFENPIYMCIEDKIWKLLPKKCETIMLYEKDICLNLQNICIFLPEMRGVQTSVIEITSGILKKDITKIYQQMINGAFRQNHEMCLMLFCNYKGYDVGSHMAALANDDKKTTSLWGGGVEKVYYINDQRNRRSNVIDNDSECVALLITGAIQTWSVVLEKIIKTDYALQDIEEKLKLFKKQVKLQKHSVGFMFAVDFTCMTNDFVTSLFSRLFPEIPLVEFYGKYKFGKDTDKSNLYLQSLCRDRVDKPESDKSQRFGNGIYASSIMILSYN